MGLPSIVMSIMMQIIHLIAFLTGISFEVIASPIFKITWFLVSTFIDIVILLTWFLVGNFIGIVILLIGIVTYYFEIWSFSSIFETISNFI